MAFVATHFIEHYESPVDILMWLYDMAEHRDKQAEATKIKA
jgi:hypothetical protein